MSIYSWSQTASNNATADATINWVEGQAPSTINDSARAMMSATAKYRDDIAGAIVTTGTSTAYAVTSYSVFDTLAHLNGQMIAFTPHTTNGATVTLNVDSLGAKPLRSAPNTELLAGVLIQGTPYLAVYNNTDGAFYLRGFYGNPYNIPLAGGLDYWGGTAPNSAFAFAFGQAISRTTYANLYALIGSAYGAGDGSTTFNLPDKRGRVSAGADGMGGVNAGRLSGATVNSVGIGGVGGTETHALTTNEIPAHTHANTLTDPGHQHSAFIVSSGVGGTAQTTIGTGGAFSFDNKTANASTGISLTNASQGGGAAHTNVQPTILCNYIMRII
jgi:microcystin-dependent protein